MAERSSPIRLELPRPTADPDQQLRDLDEFGLCLIPDALSATERQAARQRLVDQASAERNAGLAYYDGGPDEPNQRLWNLISKGQVFRDMVLKDLVRHTIGHVLDGDYLLSSFAANIACRGGEPMRLHIDQGYVPPETPYAAAANIMWMLDDFTEDNGATRVVPGSHRVFERPDPTEPIATVPAVGEAGTAMVFDARVWHGTGASVADEPRHGVLSYFCRPFLRQQENHTVSTDPEVLAGASPELRRLLGFHPWRSLGGRQGPHGVGPGPPLTSMTGKDHPGAPMDWFPEIDLDAEILGELDDHGGRDPQRGPTRR